MKRNLYNQGQAVITATIFFMAISLLVIMGISGPVIRQIKISNNLDRSTQSFYLSEAAGEDAMYRIKNGLQIDSQVTLSLANYSATVNITDISGGKEIISEGDVGNRIRKTKIVLTEGDGIAFNYGVQVGSGGLIMENGSTILGNIFSNGPITGNGNIIRGNVISAGASGLIDGIHATGTAYAHTIQNSTIDKDAYYYTISNTLVLETSHPASPDQPLAALPITDEKIAEWEALAVAGGTTNCSGTLTIDTDQAIGPQKYTCNLLIKKNGTDVTLGGYIWATGNITFDQSPNIYIDSSFTGKSLAVIADNPSDTTTSGKIVVEDNTTFTGASGESYVLLLSQNNDAESGGNNLAIEIKNNIIGDVLIYAAHGLILTQNNADLKEISGYKLKMKNNGEVIYDTGLANLLFDSGPSGGYSFDSWREVE